MTIEMNQRLSRSVRLSAAIAALALTLGLGGQVWAADAVTDQNVAERIATAQTPADHQAIATYYKGLAADAAAKVKAHESMLASYEKVGGKGGVLSADHCKTLIKTYGDAESHYQKLAAEHEALAKAGK